MKNMIRIDELVTALKAKSKEDSKNKVLWVLAIIGAKKAGPRASGQPYRKEER